MNFLIAFIILLSDAASGTILRHTSEMGIEYFAAIGVRRTFVEARAYCGIHGGVLAAPQNSLDIEFMLDNFRTGDLKLWIDGLAPRESVTYFYAGGGVVPDNNSFRKTRSVFSDNPNSFLSSCNYDSCGIYICNSKLCSQDATWRINFICQKTVGILPLVTESPEIDNRIDMLRQELAALRSEMVSKNDMEDYLTQMQIVFANHQGQQLANSTEQPLQPIPLGDVKDLELPDGLNNDHRVHIGGKPTRMGFRVSFQKNATNEAICFQMSVDFARKIVERTSYLREDWGPKHRYGGFPFDLDQYFNIVIRVDETRFYVIVNGQDFCSFDHRCESSDIKLLRVEGNVHDLEIRV